MTPRLNEAMVWPRRPASAIAGREDGVVAFDAGNSFCHLEFDAAATSPRSSADPARGLARVRATGEHPDELCEFVALCLTRDETRRPTPAAIGRVPVVPAVQFDVC